MASEGVGGDMVLKNSNFIFASSIQEDKNCFDLERWMSESLLFLGLFLLGHVLSVESHSCI